MFDLLATCEDAARAGGRILLDWRRRFSVHEKGPADLVTEADFASQEAIRKLIAQRFPTHAFLGEETPGALELVRAEGAEWTWVVDPLDGTTNYVHGLAQYSVSVAVLHRGAVAAGCVYDPVAKDCYAAARGTGATLNREPIHHSRQTDIAQALVAASFPARVDASSPEVAEFLRILPQCQAFRRMGSAALNLCYVAAGMLDAYWSTSTKMWDIAAGALIVQEAGGTMTAPDGGPLDLRTADFVAAATPDLNRRLVELLQPPKTSM